MSKFQNNKIENLIEQHKSRYAHNKLPFEQSLFLQLVHSPIDQSQFISVQQVKRLKKIACGYANAGGAQQNNENNKDAKDAKEGQGKNKNKIKKITQDLFLGGQVEDAKEQIFYDRGKAFYKYKYKTCQSEGPKLNKDFNDPDGQIEGVGDGKWDKKSMEPQCCKGGGSCECEDSREYLIIALWTYNAQADTIALIREYTVDQPYVACDNIRPLYISEQAQVAFWFERDKEDKLVCAEVSLNDPKNPTKTTMQNDDDLRRLLSDGKQTYTFSLTRINTKDGEPLLVYSKPRQTKSEQRAGIIKSSREAAAAIVKAQSDSMSILKHANTLQKQAQEVVKNRGRASILIQRSGIDGDDDDQPLVQLRFFSLRSQTQIYEIDDADALLEYNSFTDQVWVSRIWHEFGEYADEVALIQWNRQSQRPQESDFLEKYISDVKDSDIVAYRLADTKSLDIFFSSSYNKLVYLSGNKFATIYDLDRNSNDDDLKDRTMKYRKHIGLLSQMFICKGDSDIDVYLCQMNKDKRELNKEEQKKIPESSELFEILLFDLTDGFQDKPLEAKFSLTANVNKDFSIGNSRYMSGLYIGPSLDIQGPLLDGDRSRFGFIRSNLKEEASILPSQTHKDIQISYPCVIYRTPHSAGNKVFVESLYSPEQITILDLGKWSYIQGVETVRKESKGLVQPFCAIAKSPQGKICLIMIKVNPFEFDSKKYITWHLLGVLQSLSVDPIQTDGIIHAKLLESSSRQAMTIIAQYDGELVAIKVSTEISSRAEADNKRFKMIEALMMNRTSRRERRQTQTGKEEQSINVKIEEEKEVPQEKIHKFKFGEKICPGNELQAKSILLSKSGLKVYFVQRDFNRKTDLVMSIQLQTARPDAFANSIDIKIEKVFECSDSRILYVGFDLLLEQIGDSQHDAFYILDSQRKIHRLTESERILESGLTFEKQSFYTVQKTIDLEAKLGSETLARLSTEKLFNTKWPSFNITMRSIQYKNLTVGFDSDQVLPMLLDKDKNVANITGIRGTACVGGHYKIESGAGVFFVKPNSGSRIVDCLGIRGPTPVQTHLIGNGLFLYTLTDSIGQPTNVIFNAAGRYLGDVWQPRNTKSTKVDERYEDLVPIQTSYDSQYFLMVKTKGTEIVDGRKITTWKGGVAKLTKNQRQYEFDEIRELEEFRDMKDTERSERMNTYFHIDTSGKLFSIRFEILDVEAESVNGHEEEKVTGHSTYHVHSQYTEIVIGLPELESIDESFKEELSHIHVELTQNYIVIMRRNGYVLKIKRSLLDKKCNVPKKTLKWSKVDLAIADFYENKQEVDEIGLKWMYVQDVVQFKLKSCLIHYDLDKEFEIDCLNNYQGAFDDPSKFVLTSFLQPVRKRTKYGLAYTRKYIAISHNESIVRTYEDKLNGRAYRMHDELTLFNLKRIIQQYEEGQQITKVDPILLQSTYGGVSVFHLCNNRFAILECLHKQICGTITPGEVGEIYGELQEGVASKDSIGNTVSFQAPWFRRVCQLLLRKNNNGKSPLNQAIMQKNFRCFELMLSILTNATDVFVSKNFLQDLGFMLEVEAKTVDKFFDEKMVENKSTKDIEKVRWTIEEESVRIVLKSQLFTKKQIEEYTAPAVEDEENEQDQSKTGQAEIQTQYTLGIHAQLQNQVLTEPTDSVASATSKSVDVKLLDLDWVFQDGNGRKFIWMLALTDHELLFSTKQVNTVIDLLWDKYQLEIYHKVFMPYCIYFASALFYFTFFLTDAPRGGLSDCFEFLLKVLVISNMVLFESIEIIQARAAGFQVYFDDLWNVIDTLSFCFNALTLILNGFDVQIGIQKNFAAIAIFLLYLKFFYWLRLFDSTAAFIRMIKEIIFDIIPFMIFLVICIAMFSNTVLMFDQSRKLQDNDAVITDEVFGIPWIDAFVRSYLIGLGEFAMDNFNEGNDGWLIWIFFLLSTFVTQLVFMNLLIAIMGDTFDRVQEVKIQAAAKEKIAMITDFVWVLDLQEEFKDSKYVLVVEQCSIQDQNSQWEGKIGQLKQFIKAQAISQQVSSKNSFADLKQQNAQMEYQNRALQDQVNNLQGSVAQIGSSYQKNKRFANSQMAEINLKLDTLINSNGNQGQGLGRRETFSRAQRSPKGDIKTEKETGFAMKEPAFEPGRRMRTESAFQGFNK